MTPFLARPKSAASPSGSFLYMGLFSSLFVGRGNQSPLLAAAAAFPAFKFPFGNRPLTMISVWLGAQRRADSPRFDTLAGDAGPGFGRATHATQDRALAQANRRGWRAAVEPEANSPGGFGTSALRGYRT